ncbi:MAG TPA: hypothetical protein VE710_09750 [Candidatus Bathyarchaeia archaeon]|nr:hypothetical protein [Candidatus Bathyarchaeia archaeon]
MKRWSKYLITPVLVAALAAPVSVSAQPMNLQQEGHSPDMQMVRKNGNRAHKAHEQQYMLLLAEKYTPDKVAEWKAVFAEREQLFRKWKSVREKQKLDPHLVEKKEQYKKYKDVLKQKLGNGEITKDQMKSMLNEWKEKNFPERAKLDAQRRERHAAFRQTRQAFDEAIASGNESAIRSILPKLLAQEKEKNQYIANKLKQNN